MAIGTGEIVISHITSIASATTDYTIPANKGIMIDFKLQSVGLMDFDKVHALMQTGYQKTMEIMPQIKESIKRRKTKSALQAERKEFKDKRPALLFKDIVVSGGEPDVERYIQNRMTRRNKKRFSFEELRYRYFDIVSDGGVNSFYPTAQYHPSDSTYTLNLRITEAPNLKFSLGGFYSSFSNLAFLSATYSRYAPWSWDAKVNFYFGSIYASQHFILRSDYRIQRWNFPLFQEIGVTRNAFDYYSKNPGLMYADTHPDFMKDNEVFGFLNVGTSFVGKGTIKLQLSGGERTVRYYQTRDFVSKDIPERMDFGFIQTGLSIDHNSLNFKTMATEGIQQQISASFIAGDERHVYGSTSKEYGTDSSLQSKFISSHRLWRFKFAHRQYFRTGKYISLGYHAEAMWAQQARLIDEYASLLMLPTFEPLPNIHGLFLENFRSNVYIAAGIIPVYTFTKEVLLRIEAYAFQSFTKIEQNEQVFIRPSYEWETLAIHFMGAASLIYQSPIGTISACYTYYERPAPLPKWFLSVGFGYYLHNKRAFD
jgi:NTE family protein